MNTIRIRCHQNDFTTDIPVSEWEAHDALFQSGWSVLTEDYQPTQSAQVETAEPAVDAQQPGPGEQHDEAHEAE